MYSGDIYILYINKYNLTILHTIAFIIHFANNARHFTCLFKYNHFSPSKSNSNAREFLWFDLYCPCTGSYMTKSTVGKSKEDIPFQNLITAFFSEVPSSWSHEWMSNASSWIKHVGACAPHRWLYFEVYRYLRAYNVWYNHSKLVEFRGKYGREKENATEIVGYFITLFCFCWRHYLYYRLIIPLLQRV